MMVDGTETNGEPGAAQALAKEQGHYQVQPQTAMPNALKLTVRAGDVALCKYFSSSPSRLSKSLTRSCFSLQSTRAYGIQQVRTLPGGTGRTQSSDTTDRTGTTTKAASFLTIC